MSEEKESLYIYQRLHAIMCAVGTVRKAQPQGMRYKVVLHDDVTEKVKPLFEKYGVLAFFTAIELNQDGQRTECHCVVRFQSIDSPDDFVDVPSVGYGIDNSDKGPGKAMSYAFKYALLKTLMLETGEDSDLEDIKHEPKSLIVGNKPPAFFTPDEPKAGDLLGRQIRAGWAGLEVPAEKQTEALRGFGVKIPEDLPVSVARTWVNSIEDRLSKKE